MRRRSGRRVAAAAVAACAVALGGSGCGGSGGSASTPEAAVQGLAEAIEHKDVEAALSYVDPQETPGLAALWSDVRDRAEKLGLAKGEAGLDGIDVKLTGLELSVQDETDTTARVVVNGGVLEASSDTEQMAPLLARAFAGQGEDGQRNGRLDAFSDFGVAPSIATVKRDGTWYVDAFATVADAVALAHGQPLAPLTPVASGEVPEGAVDDGETSVATSPEEAVKQYMLSVSSGSLRAVAGMLTEPARRALLQYDGYGDYLDTPVSTIGQSFASPLTLSIDTQDTDVENGIGGGKTVVVRRASGTFASYDGTASGRWRVDGQCVTVADGSGSTTSSCLNGRGPDDSEGFNTSLYLLDLLWSGQLVSQTNTEAQRLAAGLDEPLTFEVRQEGDGWKVDPAATLVNQARAIVQTADDEALRAAIATKFSIE